MPDRRGSRFVLEVLFLLALAVVLTLTTLSPIEIAGVMLVGWVIVALFEWAAWREEPHYGSGLPPRYYVPQVSLPPAQPLEPVQAGYPEARDEAPTWIASPALRAEMLGEWPVAAPPLSQPAGDDVPDAGADPDPWLRAEELPAAPLGELDPPDDPAAVEPEPEVVEPEPEAEPEAKPEAEAEPEAVEPEPVPEPVAVAPEPALPKPEPVLPEPAPLILPPPLSPPTVSRAADPPPQPEPVVRPEPDAEPEPTIDVVLARSVQGVARYSLDPLADPQPRRRFGRGTPAEPDVVEVPARPEGLRALPSRANRQD